jgi:ABC-type multidrug transport system fused ATPase/permease subunit
VRALVNRALSVKEFKEYLKDVLGEYTYGLDYIKLLEAEEARVLSDIEDAEERRMRASSGLYRAMLSGIKSRILASSLAGVSAGVVMSAVVPIDLTIKIVMLAMLIASMYYVYRIVSL